MRVRYWRLNFDDLKNGEYPIENAKSLGDKMFARGIRAFWSILV